MRLTLAWNIGWSPMKVSQLVRRYEYVVERNGHTLFEFLVNRAKLSEDQRREAYVVALGNPDNLILIAYPDPVGEEAVRGVLRSRGW